MELDQQPNEYNIQVICYEKQNHNNSILAIIQKEKVFGLSIRKINENIQDNFYLVFGEVKISINFIKYIKKVNQKYLIIRLSNYNGKLAFLFKKQDQIKKFLNELTSVFMDHYKLKLQKQQNGYYYFLLKEQQKPNFVEYKKELKNTNDNEIIEQSIEYYIDNDYTNELTGDICYIPIHFTDFNQKNFNSDLIIIHKKKYQMKQVLQAKTINKGNEQQYFILLFDNGDIYTINNNQNLFLLSYIQSNVERYWYYYQIDLLHLNEFIDNQYYYLNMKQMIIFKLSLFYILKHIKENLNDKYKDVVQSSLHYILKYEELFNIFIKPIYQSCFNDQTNKSSCPDQLKLLIHGPAGTGKTFVINQLIKFTNRLLPQIPNLILSCAYTNVASNNVLNGKTIHSLFKLSINLDKYIKEGPNPEQLPILREKFRYNALFILDEVAFIDVKLFNVILMHLHYIYNNNQHLKTEKNIEIPKNINVIALGDFYQLASRAGNLLSDKNIKIVDNDNPYSGIFYFIINFVQYRRYNDLQTLQIIHDVRDTNYDFLYDYIDNKSYDLYKLSTLIDIFLKSNKKNNYKVISTSNDDVDVLSYSIALYIAKTFKKFTLYIITDYIDKSEILYFLYKDMKFILKKSYKKKYKAGTNAKIINIDLMNNNDQDNTYYFYNNNKNIIVMNNANLSIDIKIDNEILNIKPTRTKIKNKDNEKNKEKKLAKIVYSNNELNILINQQIIITFKPNIIAKSNIQTSLYTYKLPLEFKIANISTVHSSQASTADFVYLYLSLQSPLHYKLLYVAITRVKTMSNLYLLNQPVSAKKINDFIIKKNDQNKQKQEQELSYLINKFYQQEKLLNYKVIHDYDVTKKLIDVLHLRILQQVEQQQQQQQQNLFMHLNINILLKENYQMIYQKKKKLKLKLNISKYLNYCYVQPISYFINPSNNKRMKLWSCLYINPNKLITGQIITEMDYIFINTTNKIIKIIKINNDNKQPIIDYKYELALYYYNLKINIIDKNKLLNVYKVQGEIYQADHDETYTNVIKEIQKKSITYNENELYNFYRILTAKDGEQILSSLIIKLSNNNDTDTNTSLFNYELIYNDTIKVQQQQLVEQHSLFNSNNLLNSNNLFNSNSLFNNKNKVL